MKKTISKRKDQERTELRKSYKKHQLIITLSLVPPFLLSVLFTVLYVFKISYLWLSATTALLWLALGGLFTYAYYKKWGFVTDKGVKTDKNNSIVTIYNIILIFVLAAFFIAMTLYKIF